MRKKIFYGLGIAMILLQFFSPNKNISTEANANEIDLHYAVPDEVRGILKYSCYDCHSNNTNYPWYVNIQPIGLWMQSHVNDGKRHLNFSEFGSYPEKKAKHKFEEIEDATSNGWMPLGSYLLIHGDARLSTEQAKTVSEWARALK